MDNQRNKEVVSDEYNFQPVKKTSSWVFQKWRRPSKNVGSSTSSGHEPPPQPDQMAYTHTNQPTGFVPNRRSVHQQSVRKWAILDDESENWSKNVEEFFVNGDSPFCYSGVFNRPLQLDRRFWGTLLGYTCNGYLTPEHIEGWVGRMMQWRRRQQQNEASMRWSILPPRFFDYLVDGNTKNTVNFSNGKSIPYPSFFDVDYVYFPYCVENQEWLLVQINLQTMNLVMYCSEIFSNEKYRRSVHPKLLKISVYFAALLVNIKYFKKTGAPERVIGFEVNEDHVQSYNDLICNRGVHVCMLMEFLVTGKPINVTGDFHNWCVAYRRYMADQMYFWRCLPRPGDV
ncbi:hypothetical protein R6Q57_002003 [Mikania cordata]